jgi:hypothetical protein
MADNNIKIVIAAEDQASAKMLQAGKNAELLGNQIKSTGTKVKTSTELFGAFANVLGGSELAGAAGQVAQMSEKLGQFSEMAKSGAGGLGAMKVGLAGVAAVAGFEVGKAIGNWAFGVEATNKQLERSRQLMGDMADRAHKMIEGQHKDRMMSFEFIKDPEEKTAAIEKYFGTVKNSADAAAAEVRHLEKEIKKAEKSWTVDGHWSFTGNGKQSLENMKAKLEVAKKDRDTQEQIRDELKSIVGVEEQRLAKLKEQWALQDKSKGYVDSLREELSLLKMTTEEKERQKMLNSTVEGDRGTAEVLQLQINAEKERQKLANEIAEQKKRNHEREVSEAEKLNKLYEDQAKSLQQQVFELQNGEKAAKARALVEQGMKQADADALVRAQEIIDKLKADKVSEREYSLTTKDTRLGLGRSEREVNVQSGRFVNTVRSNDPAQQTTQAVRENNALQKENQMLMKELVALNKKIADHPQITIVEQ